MVIVLFVLSLFVTGFVLSAIPTKIDETSENDYHFVPFAGDAFGA